MIQLTESAGSRMMSSERDGKIHDSVLYYKNNQHLLSQSHTGVPYHFVGMSDSVMMVESGTEASTELAEPDGRVTIDPWYIW